MDRTEEIVSNLVAAEPKVNDEIIEAMQESEKPQSTEAANVSSTYIPPPSAREAFDPSIHETDDNGNPRLTKDGAYRRKRGQKAKKGTIPVSQNTTTFTTEADTKPVDYRGTAIFFTGIVFSTCESLFGKSWKPNSQESENINTAAERFCAANDIQDLPPGIALAVAFGMYALPRLQDPETKERIRAMGESIGMVKPRKVVKNDAQHDNRND